MDWCSQTYRAHILGMLTEIIDHLPISHSVLYLRESQIKEEKSPGRGCESPGYAMRCFVVSYVNVM